MQIFKKNVSHNSFVEFIKKFRKYLAWAWAMGNGQWAKLKETNQEPTNHNIIEKVILKNIDFHRIK